MPVLSYNIYIVQVKIESLRQNKLEDFSSIIIIKIPVRIPGTWNDFCTFSFTEDTFNPGLLGLKKNIII